MSSDASAILDMAELAKDLPSLIVETNIENQVANIEKWLKPIMPVNGIALSLCGSNQSNGSIFGINIQENEIRNIERRLLENLAGNSAQKSDGVYPVALHAEGPIVSDSPESITSELSSEADGLAIRLKYNGSEFGTLLLPPIKTSWSVCHLMKNYRNGSARFARTCSTIAVLITKIRKTSDFSNCMNQ